MGISNRYTAKRAIIRANSLPETPTQKSIVAEFDARTKIDILRSWKKHIQNKTWSKPIATWVGHVEEVNRYRNIVAHHQVLIKDGVLILHSEQARKRLKSVKNSKRVPDKTIADIRKWLQEAAEVYSEGEDVLDNLERLAKKRAAKAKNQ